MKKYGLLITGIISYFLAVMMMARYESVALGLFLIAYGLIGYKVLYSAFLSIKNGELFNEYFLMSLATLGAFLLKEYPEAVAVMMFYQIGEVFEGYAVGKSRQSIADIMLIRPETVSVWKNGVFECLPVEEAKVGDKIRVVAGECIPLDGKVVVGSANLDMSALTGESIPQIINEGDEILSGSLNLDGVLEILVTKDSDESTVSKILDMVEMASMRKSKREQFITRFARYYTPVVVLSALALAIIPNLFTGFSMWQEWLYRSLIFLVVSCPCALVVSVPLSFFGGIGGASKKGILVKGSNYLEELANIDTIVFDKTGTITKGELQVSQVIAHEGIKQDEFLELMCAVEKYSKHPLAHALMEYAESTGVKSALEAHDIKEIGGRGLSGKIADKLVLCGNRTLMSENGIALDEDFNDTSIYLAYDGRYYGAVIFKDSLKPEAKAALNALKQLGIHKTVMLTGDKLSVAKVYQAELGIDEAYGDLLPMDKLTHIEALLKEKSGSVAFVGDGINDAPVLARADLGIAMGAIGSDAAIEASDVVIMDDDLNKLASSIQIARKTVRIAKENTIFAIGIKVGVLILSVFGLASLWLGVFADVGVTILAVLNALRTLYQK